MERPINARAGAIADGLSLIWDIALLASLTGRLNSLLLAAQWVAVVATYWG